MSVFLYLSHLRTKSPSGIQECDIFRAAALDTWYRIGYSRTRPRLKIYETTITQNLVYELNLLKSIFPGKQFSIYESVDENTNGDDLEIKVRLKSRYYITFVIQAKIIYHNLYSGTIGYKNLKDGTYPQISHRVQTNEGPKQQIQCLLDYARSNGHIPICLFYNYVQSAIAANTYCGVTFDEREYGCSIVAAELLRKRFCSKKGNMRMNIKYSELHPNWALPWAVLTCCFPRYDETAIFKALQVERPNYQITKEAEYKVDPTKWRPMEEAFSLNPKDYVLSELQHVVGFSPKFQIVIN